MDKFLKLLIIFTLFSFHNSYAAKTQDISDVQSNPKNQIHIENSEIKALLPVNYQLENTHENEATPEATNSNNLNLISEEDPNVIVD